jgi:subtilase family serine protease
MKERNFLVNIIGLQKTCLSFWSAALVAAISLFASGSVFGAVSGQVIVNNTPKFAASAKKMGKADPTQTIEVSLWLNLHNRSELDALAKALYDRKSPNFRHWIDRADFAAKYAPTANDAQAAKEFFTNHGLEIVSVGPANLFVRGRGTLGVVSKAFQVEIDNYQLNGQTFRANTSDPYVDGAAGPLVGAVYGLDNLQFQHPIVSQISSPGGKSSTNGQKAASNSDPGFFASNCFTGTKTETKSSGGSLPIGTYKGNGYTDNIAGCGYTPADIRTAYNLNGLYQEGYDGTGQTVVIIDWCGSPTITQDANAFSTKFGLPALTSSNFSIIPFPKPSTCIAPDPEINIDVEWTHAIAPGANIDLLVPETASFNDVDSALAYAAIEQLGNVISGSYGSEELYTPFTVINTENLISEIAAVQGIAANFSSGDYGDYTFDFGGTPSVSAPADSPYATAVGGVSLALNAKREILFQTGWGTNETALVLGDTVYDPPYNFGFTFGSGGGASAFFAAPFYQSSLQSTQRQLPDISWLADPFTGGVIAITQAGTIPPIIYQVYGGTSLSCPMFSALWAIANQEAGYPLGQAAPYLYYLPSNAITDVLPYNSNKNVTASIQEPGGTNTYTAADLAYPLENTTQFYSAIWDYPLIQGYNYVVTFGTDSGLTVTPGWDNVTGLGTPNGKAFADSFSYFGAFSK